MKTHIKSGRFKINVRLQKECDDRGCVRHVCSARLRAKRVPVDQSTPSEVTVVLTTEDLCAFARDILDAARGTGCGTARRLQNDFTLRVFNAGWSRGAFERHEEAGFGCFAESTKDLFVRFFEVQTAEQLDAAQRRGWECLGSALRERFIHAGIARTLFRGSEYDEHHADFLKVVQEAVVTPVRGEARRGSSGSMCSSV
jgi:hypothetical protein